MPHRPLTPYCLATMLVAACFADAAFADSLQNFSTASADSAEASARLSASGAQITLGAVAIPLQAVGGLTEAAGTATSWLGEEMWEAANTPLTVSEDVLSAVPPPSLAPAVQGGESH